jgi:hypothetical protein
MFETVTNLAKAAAAVAITPAALVADVLTLPASSFDPHRGPFERTTKVLEAAGQCAMEALRPAQPPK